MADILKGFWTWALSLAGIVGLYLGAKQLNWVPVFWAVLVAAAILGVFPVAAKRAFEVHSKVQSYPDLLDRVAKAETETEALRSQLLAATAAAEDARQAGILEGRAQVIGSILSEQTDPPRLVGIAEMDDTLILIGECSSDPPSREARFAVIGQVVGERKGAVEVIHVDPLKQTVHLQCVEELNGKFWSHLRERVSYDASPPARVELVPYTVASAEIPGVEAVPFVNDVNEVTT